MSAEASDSPLRASLRAHAKSTTQRWHGCQPLFTRPAQAVGGLCGVYGWPDAACEATEAPSRIRRALTWEDTLPRMLPGPVAILNKRRPLSRYGTKRPSILEWEKRRGRTCEMEWFCRHFQLPLAINSTHRAAPGFVARVDGGTSWLGLMIPKCATSTLAAFTWRRNLTTWMSWHVIEACANLSYAAIVDQASAAAAGRAATTSAPFTSCGHASTFDISPPASAFAVAFVRDPVSRFLSALSAHGAAGEVPTKRLDTLVTGLTKKDVKNTNRSKSALEFELELLAKRARRMRNRVGLVDDAHARTQSYYLAATDRAGDPIRWDAILRLEDSRNFSLMLGRALLEDLGHPSVPKHAADLFAHAHNSKTATRSARQYTAALRRAALEHDTLACDLCEIFGQDFLCLGYAWPPRCSEPACLETLPPLLRAAILGVDGSAAQGAAAIRQPAPELRNRQ